MDQTGPKYNFRRRDYAKIKNWYDFSLANYMPEDVTQQKQTNKQKPHDWHYRFMFSNLELSQHYVNSNMKRLFQIRQLVFMNSLYHRQKDCIVSSGKQIAVECQFDVTTLSLKCNQEIIFYFYLSQASPKDFQFSLQIQMINNDGEIFKFGSSKFPLLQRKDAPKQNVLLVFNNIFMDKKQRQELQTISQVKGNKSQQFQSSDLFVARIDFELDTQEIKQMKKYLPPSRIINKNSKIPPTTFNLKKKKQQISQELRYKIYLQKLMIQILNPEVLKVQLIHNNPFTFSHKELVQLQVKQYRVMVDQHNGWKTLQNKRNQFQLQLVVQKGDKTYISSKKINNLQINYFQSDLMILFAVLICKVQFRLKGVSQQRREQQFLISWLPLPLDLALKQSKIQLLMVNDLEFPQKYTHIFNVPSNFSATFLNPNFQKYKNKNDDKKLFRQHLLDENNILNSNKYTKLQSRKNATETLSSQSNGYQSFQAYLEHARQFVRNNQVQAIKADYVKVTGQNDTDQVFPAHHSMLPMEQTVGKMLKVQLQIDTFIPETDSACDYYLPRNIQGTIYFLRQIHSFSISITQKQARFNIPLQISHQKIKIYLKKMIESVQEFEAVLNSRFIVTLYQQKSYKLFAKGIATAHEILGASEADKIAYVALKRWQQNMQKSCGRLLVIVGLEVQKFRENNNKIQELDVQKVMNKLSTEERMRMRIGNFKGDFMFKTETVNLIKKKQHNEFIRKVVATEQKCDGELSYQIGIDTYHLLKFSNQDKSENNVFTFHLNCPYAQIVTSYTEFRSVIEKYNFQPTNFQRLSFYLKQTTNQSYYECKLQFTKQIGILIKLNVFEQFQKEQSLNKIQLIIKRNTIQAKKMLIRCRYKPALVWDIFQGYALYNQTLDDSVQTVVEFEQQFLQKYKDIQIMNKNVGLSLKQKKMLVSRPAKQMGILIMARPKEDTKQRVFILYRMMFFHGKQLSLLAGKTYHLNIQLQNKQEVQVLRCHHSQMQINNSLKFYSPNYNHVQDISIRILQPSPNKNIIVLCSDLSGQQLSQYLLKIQAKLEFISDKMDIILDQSYTYAVTVQNPYACSGYFEVVSSSKSVVLQETEVRLESYGQKLIAFKVKPTKEEVIYFYLFDKRGNVCQIVQANCKGGLGSNKQDQLFMK